jgi:hypothetical protein
MGLFAFWFLLYRVYDSFLTIDSSRLPRPFVSSYQIEVTYASLFLQEFPLIRLAFLVNGLNSVKWYPDCILKSFYDLPPIISTFK